MAEFSIIDSYFNRKSPYSVDLGVGDDSALLTLLHSNNWSFVPIPWLLDVTSRLIPAHMRLAGNLSRSIYLISLQWARNLRVFYWP